MRHPRLMGLLLVMAGMLLAGCGDAERADNGTAESSDAYVESMSEQHAEDSAAASGAENLGGNLGEISAMPVLSETIE